MDTYTIIALPEDSTLEKLNGIKDYLSKNGFKGESKPNTSDAHITIGQAELSEESLEALKQLFSSALSDWRSFSVAVKGVSQEVRPGKDGRGDVCWVALLFDEDKLKDLYELSDPLISSVGVNQNEKYVQYIRAINPRLKIFDCIANHMNLCNGCLPEKSAEAVAYIKDNAPSTILIDRVCLRRKRDSTHVWTISLHE